MLGEALPLVVYGTESKLLMYAVKSYILLSHQEGGGTRKLISLLTAKKYWQNKNGLTIYSDEYSRQCAGIAASFKFQGTFWH